MAARNFVVRQIENLKTEAQWLADETYQILPNEAVVAIVPKTMTVDGVEKTVNYIRTKVNTSTTSRLFKELEYSDEYINMKIEGDLAQLGSDFDDEITALKARLTTDEETITQHSADIQDLTDTTTAHDTRIKTNTDDITALKGRMDTAESDITKHSADIQDLTDTTTAHETSITTINTNITNINTSIEQIKDDFDEKLANIDFSELESDIAKNASDISDLQSRVSTNEDTIAQHAASIQDLTDTTTAHETSISPINTNITNIQTSISNIDNTEIVGIKSRLDGAEETINQHTSTLQSLSDDITAVSNSIKPASVLSQTQPAAGTLNTGGIWFKTITT